MGFFLAVLLGAVFSSFNSLLNSAATLFCLDIYLPFKQRQSGVVVNDKQLVTVAKRASVVIALFSFVVAPLLQFAPEGLWQIIRIFTGFYNIPVIAIVIVGLFTRRVPALAAKLAIIFHVVAYGLLRFVFDDWLTIHFLHLYGILFVFEVAMMLVIGQLYPRRQAWTFKRSDKIDLQRWRYAVPCSVTLASAVVGLYLLFSPVGLVDGLESGLEGGLSVAFWPLILTLIGINIIIWWSAARQQFAIVKQ
jgi:SSS family solute:Na+ symporter